MKNLAHVYQIRWSIVCGVFVGLAAMLFTVKLASAAPANQTEPLPTGDPQTCGECHLNVANAWSTSPHAHAYDDPVFVERWNALGAPKDCLLCHTTSFQATTGEFAAEGVSCEACHGKVDAGHPPAAVPIRASTEYCGTCHTTTLGEWRLTGHSAANVGCTDCHDPHSQKALFEVSDEMCLNCHKDSMGPYLEDLHVQKGIGCVDCHALVIPPEVEPVDGIVPTGHTFTITPATCVACHTDTLHAGFSLPGYEHGAKANNTSATTEERIQTIQQRIISPEEQIQRLQSQVNALEASSASRNMSVLFQGGVVGLVLGGSTAWIVAHNVRRRKQEEEAHHEKTE